MSFEKRQMQVIQLAAEKALELPPIKNNYWFLDDIRDNFYYAMHLYTASQDNRISLTADKKIAKERAEDILFHSIKLQDQNEHSEYFGHWPLNLDPNPELAEPNTLPVEFFGGLLLHFYNKHSDSLSSNLLTEMETAMFSIYKSDLLNQNPEQFIHHETKIFVLQLMYGKHFNDTAMLCTGYSNIKAVLSHSKENGLREYGSLPWLWHWIQSVDFARNHMTDETIKQTLTELLDFLWKERATFYLKGAWIGSHSRSLPHDIPKYSNTLNDYIQFGDLPKPNIITRLEGAGFISYQAPDSIRQLSIDHSIPIEVKKKVNVCFEESENPFDALHHYAYITDSYAVGGLWERTNEYLNEQHRWGVSLPVQNNLSINQLYFFHPGEGYQEGDARHQSPNSQVIYHKNVVGSLYHQLNETNYPFIIGFLPKAKWVRIKKNICADIEDVYISIYLHQPYSITDKDDLIFVKSYGNQHAVVVEILAKKEAENFSIMNFNQFQNHIKAQETVVETSDDSISIMYKSLHEDIIKLAYSKSRKLEQIINGHSVRFTDYTI
ncbi:hypothetical protein [Paraliobacillus sediminis]|uniref:hypothetical protein n=1 Tax=Paraliobacillus sediminis TaxID=1885916 RepID=UPI000E3D75D9|nr:hypothetical protein [Paraliobacillus sediminis]